MSVVRFAHVCDHCGKRGPEYEAFLHCRNCGRDLCPDHRNHDFDDGERCLTLCANDVGCQLERDSENMETEAKDAIPEVTMQDLFSAGLNAFGLQLFVESIAEMHDAATFKPITFKFRGIRITMQPDGEIDTRHHLLSRQEGGDGRE